MTDLDNLIAAFEALVFAASQPLSFAQAGKALAQAYQDDQVDMPTEALLKQAWMALQQRWQHHAEHRPNGFTLHQINAGLVFHTTPKFAKAVQALLGHKPPKLSKALLETLAIIAYRQPIIKADIDHLRGVDGSGSLKALLERDLVQVVGKKEEVGHPSLYGTTAEFLQFFQLQNLKCLPSLRDFIALQEATVNTEQQHDEQLLQLVNTGDDKRADVATLAKDVPTTLLDEAVTALDVTLTALA